MRLVEGGQEDVDRSLVSAVLGRMGVTWDCLSTFLITTGTTVEFPKLEPQLSTERLTAAELASDTALFPIRVNGGNAYPLRWLQSRVKASSAPASGSGFQFTNLGSCAVSLLAKRSIVKGPHLLLIP